MSTDNGQTWQPPPGTDAVLEFAQTAQAGLNGIADATGLTAKVEKSPYAMLAAAVGIGYVVGGGLLTPTTFRIFQLGLKLASVPLIQNSLFALAETALDGVLSSPPDKQRE
jgi:hypothetical protein